MVFFLVPLSCSCFEKTSGLGGLVSPLNREEFQPWTDEYWKILMIIVVAIEQHFGFQVPRVNGVPCVTLAEYMPRDWSRKDEFERWVAHYHTMTEWCDPDPIVPEGLVQPPPPSPKKTPSPGSSVKSESPLVSPKPSPGPSNPVKSPPPIKVETTPVSTKPRSGRPLRKPKTTDESKAPRVRPDSPTDTLSQCHCHLLQKNKGLHPTLGLPMVAIATHSACL